MAEEHGRPRRNSSLRTALTNRFKQSERTGQAVQSQNKPTLVQFHITEEDISKTNTASAESRRGTWPGYEKHRQSGGYSFDVTPTLVKTPWESARSKKPGQRQGSIRKPLKSSKFAHLPKEITFCILGQLRLLYSSGSMLNVASYQSDLSALCLTNKSWHRLAHEYLYGEIWLPGNNARNNGALSFKKNMSRLQLLMRTLDESPAVSDVVHHLRVTSKLADELEFETLSDRPTSKDSSIRLLRDIILKCRNLEQISGYAPIGLEGNRELFDALRSREWIKSHIWRLCPEFGTHRAADMLRHHTPTTWNHLQTLVIWQSVDGYHSVPGLISAIVQRLPSLKRLMLKGLLPNDFHNGTLLMLPALKSLRLEDVHGVTDQGIEQLAHSRLAMSLENLILADLELTSLQSMQTLLANLTQLRSFTLYQNTSPEIPVLLTATNINFWLASATLQSIHWDVLAQGNDSVIIANSIAAGKFPKLRSIKIPSDHDGVVQNLCRPIGLEPISGQDMLTLEGWEQSTSYHRSLRVAQIQAQLRVRNERQQPSLKLVVQDESELTEHTHVIGSYLGALASRIEYSLDPAIRGTGYALARVEDVVLPWNPQYPSNMEKGMEAMLDLTSLFE